jgi:hypothetical protein
MATVGKGKDLRKLTKSELTELAKSLHIKVRSKATKDELIAQIESVQRDGPSLAAVAPTSTLAPLARGKPPKKSAKDTSPAAPVAPPSTASSGEMLEAAGRPFQPIKAPEHRSGEVDRLTGELPLGYGDTRIVLQVRDPHWAHAYWEINDQTKAELRHTLGDEGYARSAFILRVYDVTDIQFTGDNAHSFFDIHIFEGANNWYIHLGRPDRAFLIDLGLISPHGQFVLIARSNTIRTPRDTYSDVVDEQWMVVDEAFREIYRASGGFQVGASSGEIRQAMSQRLLQELSSGAVSSLSSPVRPAVPAAGKDFWLVVNTELIVYGATEPDARLTVQGKPVKLRPDGTFSLRFALPDGDQHIPVHAVNRDGDMERTITPIVHKTTR